MKKFHRYACKRSLHLFATTRIGTKVIDAEKYGPKMIGVSSF